MQVNVAIKAGAVIICTAVFLENLICEKSTRSPSGLSFSLDAGLHARFRLPAKKKKESVSPQLCKCGMCLTVCLRRNLCLTFPQSTTSTLRTGRGKDAAASGTL